MCSISPIFSIGRVVRILLRERKKRGKRNKKKSAANVLKTFAIKSVAGGNVIDNGAKI